MGNARTTTRAAAGAAAHGFTMLELMVTLTLAGLLVALAVPSMRDTYKNGELASAANDIIRSLQLARTEAVKRQRAVVWCTSTNPLAAAPACGFAQPVGWIVFQDNAGNQAFAAGDPIIERHDRLGTDITVHEDGNNVQSYSPVGFAIPPGGAYVPTRNILLCNTRGNKPVGTGSTARAVLISQTGRARVSSLYLDTTNTLAALGTTCP